MIAFKNIGFDMLISSWGIIIIIIIILQHIQYVGVASFAAIQSYGGKNFIFRFLKVGGAS